MLKTKKVSKHFKQNINTEKQTVKYQKQCFNSVFNIMNILNTTNRKNIINKKHTYSYYLMTVMEMLSEIVFCEFVAMA